LDYSAANNGHIACVAALLAHGADPATRNLAGQTARDLAMLAGFKEVVSVFDVRFLFSAVHV
jgi:ankyrin repeat protein